MIRGSIAPTGRQLVPLALLMGIAPPALAAERPDAVILVADDLDYANPTLHALDYMRGDRGRLIYGCEPIHWLSGVCMP